MRSEHCTAFFKNRLTAVYAWPAGAAVVRVAIGPGRRLDACRRRCRCGSGSGARAAWAISQSGSQWGFPITGRPYRCGSPVKRMPRAPSATQRSISRTVASTSQNGVATTGSKPPEIGRRPVEEEVVVRGDAQQLELLVVHRQEVLAPEAADVRVQDLRPDPRPVHVAQTRGGVVGAGVHVGVGRRVLRWERRPPCGRGHPHRRQRLVVEHPQVLRALAGRRAARGPGTSPGPGPSTRRRGSVMWLSASMMSSGASVMRCCSSSYGDGHCARYASRCACMLGMASSNCSDVRMPCMPCVWRPRC